MNINQLTLLVTYVVINIVPIALNVIELLVFDVKLIF